MQRALLAQHSRIPGGVLRCNVVCCVATARRYAPRKPQYNTLEPQRKPPVSQHGILTVDSMEEV
jgi:hypothetical protein